MSKKSKIIIVIIVIILFLIIIHLVRNYIILNGIYNNINKFINYNDNYKFTSITYTPGEVDKVHNVYEDYVKDNILKARWEFTPEYTEETKDLNCTSIYWKNMETNEKEIITVDSEENPLTENLVHWNEDISYKSRFHLDVEDGIKDLYLNNIFNILKTDEGFYKINQLYGNYFKIKITDKTCEILIYNKDFLSIKQQINLNAVSDVDVSKIDIK